MSWLLSRNSLALDSIIFLSPIESSSIFSNRSFPSLTLPICVAIFILVISLNSFFYHGCGQLNVLCWCTLLPLFKFREPLPQLCHWIQKLELPLLSSCLKVVPPKSSAAVVVVLAVSSFCSSSFLRTSRCDVSCVEDLFVSASRVDRHASNELCNTFNFWLVPLTWVFRLDISLVLVEHCVISLSSEAFMSLYSRWIAITCLTKCLAKLHFRVNLEVVGSGLGQ